MYSGMGVPGGEATGYRQNPPATKSTERKIPRDKIPAIKIPLAIRICICNRAFTFSSRKSFYCLIQYIIRIDSY